MMNEENEMDDETPQNARSESAFFGMSDEHGRRHADNSKFPLTVDCKAYLVRSSGNVRFDLWKPSLEKRSGVRFENDRMYVVRGIIKGVGGFESRHLGSTNPHVYVFFDGSDPKVVPGERYSLQVEAIEEKRRFEVLPSMRGPCIRVTRPVLEGLGVRTDERSIVELQLRRPGIEETRKAYAHWEPDWGFIQLYLGGAGFAEGDVVEVVGGRSYSLESFVSDFERHRRGELSNVELSMVNGGLTAMVDGGCVPVEKYWLATHGLRAALKLELGYSHRMMKFVFDGNWVEARFGNSDAIIECAAIGRRLDVRYSRAAGQTHVMTMERRPQGCRQSFDWLAGGVRVIDRPTNQGIYLLEISETVREMTRQKLNETRSGQTYARLRGDIGEEIAKALLGDVRLKLLCDHPWSELGPTYGSLRHGPDFLVAFRDSGLVAYLEIKWWEDVLEAFKRGEERVRYYVRSTPVWKGVRVDGGYIAVLDWKLTKTARLWVEKVV